MKYIVLILMCITIMACSQKSDIVGVKAGDEYYGLDHAAKEALVNNKDDEELVCKRVQITGSHFKEKRCTTRKQMQRDRDRSLDSMQRNSEFNNIKLTAEKGGGG